MFNKRSFLLNLSAFNFAILIVFCLCSQPYHPKKFRGHYSFAQILLPFPQITILLLLQKLREHVTQNSGKIETTCYAKLSQNSGETKKKSSP